MTVRIRVGITIDASPAQVWDAIEPLERHTEWMADAESIRFLTSRTRGVGTEMECVTRVGPLHTTDLLTVTEWEPRRALAIEHRGAVTGSGRFTLARRRRGRTRFTWTERLRFPWWMGGVVGERLAKPVLRRIWRRNLIRLAASVEESRDD